MIRDKETGRDGLCEVHDEMVRRVPEVRPELAKTTAGDEPSGIEPRITKGQQLCEVKDEMVSRVPEVEDRME